MKSKKKIILIIAIVIIIAIIGIVLINRNSEKTSKITVVPTMNDKITANSSWCGTFQLIWNDMKNKVVKKDIVFNPQLDMVKNLNKEDFNESMLSDDYYFKIYGPKSLELKEDIFM